MEVFKQTMIRLSNVPVKSIIFVTEVETIDFTAR